ncbi:FecR family protein [Chitinophaga sp. XS-30]|uniref:FecR family protein n=1 Tax=Chitinophaga sp. XS-30 TaxID=2604421 RepID=UPI0011DE2F41|nr:FecR family protein [Chitinophaga sp. XS-30]QEH41208.1 FecR family protein [Chitinophaga sp. XS-30]
MEPLLQSLLDKYLEGNLTQEERDQLARLMRSPQSQVYFAALLDEQFNDDTRPLTGDAATGERILGELMKQIPQTTVRRIQIWRWAAAAAILLISLGTYLLYNSDQPVKVAQQTEISPGKNGAILTLADNTQVSLDTLRNGIIALQGGAVAKVVNGSLVYEAKGNEVMYNTMHTPNGRQFQIVLPDGTQVWLNAASSIRYPTVFTGRERRVEIKGEAYFEVAKKKNMPFRVNVNNKAEVEVLGTYFNINAYEEEPSINTTLLEGAVSVGNVVLKPGQQARITDSIQIVDNIDVSSVTAWKNGFFDFEGQSLRVVMRQLERWYDIKVVYKNNVQDIIFRGKIFRNLKLGDVLYILQKMGVKFEMEGRTLTVTA